MEGTRNLKPSYHRRWTGTVFSGHREPLFAPRSSPAGGGWRGAPAPCAPLHYSQGKCRGGQRNPIPTTSNSLSLVKIKLIPAKKHARCLSPGSSSPQRWGEPSRCRRPHWLAELRLPAGPRAPYGTERNLPEASGTRPAGPVRARLRLTGPALSGSGCGGGGGRLGAGPECAGDVTGACCVRQLHLGSPRGRNETPISFWGVFVSLRATRRCLWRREVPCWAGERLPRPGLTALGASLWEVSAGQGKALCLGWLYSSWEPGPGFYCVL